MTSRPPLTLTLPPRDLHSHEFAPFVMYGFSTFASGTVPQNYAQQSRPFQNSPIAHRLHNQESDRRPREPRFAQSSRVLRFKCPEGHMTLPLG